VSEKRGENDEKRERRKKHRERKCDRERERRGMSLDWLTVYFIFYFTFI
jgi:hypothetical protein